jgi:hypothetical protein
MKYLDRMEFLVDGDVESATGTVDAVTTTTLQDAGAGWTTNEWVGYWIYNTSDSSRGLITANDGTTITADLQGGTNNNWQITDTYLIAKGVNEDLTQGITHRFMVKTKYHDAAIDEFKLIGTTRGFHRSYSEFKINATGRGTTYSLFLMLMTSITLQQKKQLKLGQR